MFDLRSNFYFHQEFFVRNITEYHMDIALWTTLHFAMHDEIFLRVLNTSHGDPRCYEISLP